MSNVNGLGTGPTPICYIQNDREAFFASQAEMDKMYDEAIAASKHMETLSKAEVKSSANPDAVMNKLKLSDRERLILADVAEINGWCRQGVEATYKMFIAGPDANSNSIGDFLKALTKNAPGYYGDDGGTMLGLTETDRRRILNLPQEKAQVVGRENMDVVAPNVDDVPFKKEAEKNLSLAIEAMNKKLTDEEHAALSEAAQLNGVDEQSAEAYYKIYLAKNSSPSMSDFLQLLIQNEPNSYGKDGGLKHSDDDEDRAIRVTI